MRIKRYVLSGLVCASLLAGVAIAHGQTLPAYKMEPPPYTLTEIQVPMVEAGNAGLQVLLALPSLPGSHPLVLLTHDEIPLESNRKITGPGVMLREARWFVVRGWAVAMVMRRANGKSGGKFTHDYVVCDPDLTAEEYRDSAKDLRAVANFLSTWPGVDTTRMIATGYHLGGAAGMWLAEDDSLPGLKAVVSFSLGWDHVTSLWVDTCIRDGVKPMYEKLGSKTKVPMLWVLQTNGDPGGHKEEVAAAAAFQGAGGKADVLWLKRSAPKSNALFNSDPKEWTANVEAFLSNEGLPSSVVLNYIPSVVTEVPFGNVRAEEGLKVFLEAGPNKALAIAPHGFFGYATGMASLELAKKWAVDSCGNFGCKVVISMGK